MSLLRSDLRGIIGSALSDLFLSGTLTKVSTSYNGDGDHVQGSVAYAVKMVEESYSDIARVGGIPSDQRKFIILADGLAVVPTTDDTLTFEGETLSIIKAQRDPAGATYMVETR